MNLEHNFDYSALKGESNPAKKKQPGKDTAK